VPDGIEISESMVGRILTQQRRRGVFPIQPRGVLAWRRRQHRLYAVRKPKEYEPSRPGDLVQVDTMDVNVDGTSYNTSASNPTLNLLTPAQFLEQNQPSPTGAEV
jgi:hypothetical protein